MSYIRNVADNTKKGGYYIGCCYNGKRVYDTLSKNEGKMEYIDDMGNLVYSIKRDYGEITNDFEYTEEMLDLVLANCDKFPKKDEYEKLLPTV